MMYYFQIGLQSSRLVHALQPTDFMFVSNKYLNYCSLEMEGRVFFFSLLCLTFSALIMAVFPFYVVHWSMQGPIHGNCLRATTRNVVKKIFVEHSPQTTRPSSSSQLRTWHCSCNGVPTCQWDNTQRFETWYPSAQLSHVMNYSLKHFKRSSISIWLGQTQRA